MASQIYTYHPEVSGEVRNERIPYGPGLKVTMQEHDAGFVNADPLTTFSLSNVGSLFSLSAINGNPSNDVLVSLRMRQMH